MALALLAPACTLAQVDATADEICLTYPDIAVAGPGASVSTAIAQSFVFDNLHTVHELMDAGVDLEFVRAQVRTSSTDVLRGIQRASVGVASNDPGSTLPRLVAYACDGNCVEPDASLDLPADNVRDALAYMASGSLAVDVSASGELPAHAWTMDVDVCLRGHAHYAFDPTRPAAP